MIIYLNILSQQMIKRSVFELIHQLQNSRKNQTYFPTLMYITNTAIHVAIFLSIPTLSIIGILTILNNRTLIYVLSGFIFAIFIQIFIYLLKNKQNNLYHQLAIFRFIISPIMAYGLLLATKQGNILQGFALLLFVFSKFFSSSISRSVLYQFYRKYTLNITQSSIIFQFDTFQTFLISNCFIVDRSQILLIGLTFGSALLTTYRHFLHQQSQEYQYKILFFTNIVHVFLSAFCFAKVIFPSLHSGYAFFSIVPLFILLFFAIKYKRKLIQNNIEQLLTNKLSFQQFIQAVDCFLTLTKHNSSSNNKRKLINYIYAILIHHKQKCMMSHCQLESPSTKQQLKNITSQNLKQLILKLMKKIEWIFQQYYSKESNDLVISLIFLKFYAEYLQNKTKMTILIKKIQQNNNLSFSTELQLSKYRETCSNIQNLDNIDVIKDEEIYIEFQSAMVATLNCMIEFWSEFSQQKVDLGKIMAIAIKLFPFKDKVEKIFNQQLKIQKFTAFKILKLYILYLKRILNKFELASKVEDVQQILSNLLKDKQDIQYLSKQTQSAFIVICLSESKLGDIFMVNEKACDIFRYTKKKMLSLRVNNIMPSVIADIHDQILTDFLKKKRKKYNTDQRMLFGKDGHGYIFPILLQLQRASFSSNDQFIFIASVTPEKLKSPPIYCIVDHQGEITDYTSSFRNIFLKKSFKKNQNRSIQEIIPSYFDIDYSEKSLNVRQVTQFINNNKIGEIQAKFLIAPILVKNTHEGYLVKLLYNIQRAVSLYPNLCFTENLREKILKRQIKCMQNHYNHILNYYQISQKAIIINPRSFGPQFTIPFLCYQDMAQFANSTEIKRYGNDIKTIRLVGNHLERVDEQSSFYSQSFTNDGKVNVRAKIQQLRHKFSKNQDKKLIFIFKILTNLIIIIAIILAMSIYAIYIAEALEQKQFLTNFDSKKKVHFYLPQYIVSFTCANSEINKYFFQNHLKDIQPLLMENIIKSKIDEYQKEQMMRIVYLKSSTQLVNLLQTSSFHVAESDTSVQKMLQMLWGFMIGLSGFFALNFIIMFYYYNQILFAIYTLFLSLKESSIKKIEQNCKVLISKIYFQSQENVEKEEQKRVIEEDQEQNQLQKIKQFKNTSRRQDYIHFLKLIVPLVFISAFLLFLLLESDRKFQLYQTIKHQHNIIFETIPASSIQITKIILKFIDSITLNIDNSYEKYYQLLQLTVLEFNKNAHVSSYIDVLYGNICTNSNAISEEMMESCNKIGNGILKSGITSTMNFIAQDLKDITLKNKITTDNIELLFTLQFLFINPALISIEESMENILIEDIQSFSSFFSSMVIILICLYIIYDVYLIIYPLNIIQTQIQLTNQMISLMPDNAGQDMEQHVQTQS